MRCFLIRAFFASFLALSVSCPALKAQQQLVGCIDRNIRLQADEIKQHYTAQGLTVFRDAMLNMESMTPFPVLVPFSRGKLYQIVFVGHIAAARIKMELFDGQDHKIDQQDFRRKHEEPNFILFTFVPKQTDTYLLTFLQKLKHEHLCGSLCILELTTTKTSVRIIPYHQ